jgi:hypothetical protein
MSNGKKMSTGNNVEYNKRRMKKKNKKIKK